MTKLTYRWFLCSRAWSMQASKLTAKLWDLKVDWSDGSPSDEWLKLNLTKFDKLTLKYDKATDTTTAIID